MFSQQEDAREPEYCHVWSRDAQEDGTRVVARMESSQKHSREKNNEIILKTFEEKVDDNKQSLLGFAMFRWVHPFLTWAKTLKVESTVRDMLES